MIVHFAPNRNLPAVIKISYTTFVVILVPIYWVNYGPTNFLWLSDIGMLSTVYLVWFRSPLINSMMAVGVLPVELAWAVDFFGELLFNLSLINIADYMFDPEKSFLLRGLSLFHLVTPVIWIWLLRRWGYDPRALKAQTVLFWLAITATYFWAHPEKNINWVFQAREMGWRISPQLWLAALLVFYPIIIHLPTHYLLKRTAKSGN